jgi:PBSX family phage portal protein
MRKKNANAARRTGINEPVAAVARTPGAQAFTFGEPEAIDRASLLDYRYIYSSGRWYEPPVSLVGLANMVQVAPHHASALYLKRNLLVESFVPSSFLSTREFSSMTMDYLTFNNGYFQVQRSIGGNPLKLLRMPSLQTRVGLQPGQFWFCPEGRQETEFKPGDVVHLFDVDLKQEIYGVPEYLSALHAAQLNRSATLFRRKYYDNGSHAGFILSMTDPAQDPEDIDAIRDALRNSKGPGNFRNLFVYTPGGSKDGIKLIPISEVGARDDFASIKNTSRDDVLVAHRVPPQLLGVVPTNAGGFGNVDEARKAFMRTEIRPIQTRMAALNEDLGVNAIAFRNDDQDE